MIKGSNSGNTPRKIAMYLCQALSGSRLFTIAGYFNLSHTDSVSYIIHKIRQQMLVDNGFRREIENLINGIAIKVI